MSKKRFVRIASMLLWPLALAGIAGCDRNAADQRGALFSEVTAKSKLDFIHDAGVDSSYFMPESIGSGAAMFDYNNDGLLDLYFVNGGPHGRAKNQKPAAPNRLFQQQPDGTFLDVTAPSGLGDTGYGMGVATGDIDNDGDLDLYISNYGPDALYRNNGDGTFTDVTARAGIRNTKWGCSVTFLDADLNGYLDIYITNYVDYDGGSFCMDHAGRQDYCGPKGFAGVSDVLFKNLGPERQNGESVRFENVSVQAGLRAVAYRGLGVVSADFNGDGYPDMYVANDGDPNNLWINQGDGAFVDEALANGVAFNALGQAEAGMGIALGDVENDGDLDLFVSHVRNETNTLYVFEKSIGYADQSAASGVAGPSLALTGFGAGFLDYDHDGDLDLAVVNGRVTRGILLTSKKQADYWDHYAEPNLLFENSGAGQFRRIDAGEPFCERTENSRGLAFGDIDNDGDVDLLVANAGGPARLYENVADKKGHFLSVRAIDPAYKRDAIGATITLFCGDKQFQRAVMTGYSFLSSSDVRTQFGVGAASRVDSIHVRWPGGALESFAGSAVDRMLILRKGEGATITSEPSN